MPETDRSTPERSAEYWIKRLALQPHPEGGYFRETYRADESIEPDDLPSRFTHKHSLSTCIYFLLPSGRFSHFHRLTSDEIWHYYHGAPATLYIISADGLLSTHLVGANLDRDEHFQTLIPHGSWFAAEVNVPNSYTLVGCTVAPGFEFEDFELADRERLIGLYPAHSELIARFTFPPSAA